MPRYDYVCRPCDLEFEVSRSFADADLPLHCPSCDKPAKRRISLPMATFTRGAGAAASLQSVPSAPSSRWSHHGHSHGPGGAGHLH